jgi:multisubunit Na+/H+ antiporter MnhC subunit
MEKISLPIKTKIAVLGMIVCGAILAVAPLFCEDLKYAVKDSMSFFIYFASPIVIGALLIISSYFLLKRKKWAWWLAIISLSLIFISILLPLLLIAIKAQKGEPDVPEIILYLFFAFIDPIVQLFSALGVAWLLLLIPLLPIISFIFLLQDRKNFWKIAS